MKKILMFFVILAVLTALCTTAVFAEDTSNVVTQGDIKIETSTDQDTGESKVTGSINIESLFDKSVAKIGETKYESLQEAIDAAQAGSTIVLLKDLTIESDLANAAKGYFNIAKGQDVILDMNGKTINVTENSNGNFILFYNYGTFTIKNGTINLTSTIDRDWNAQSTIILNRGGNFTMESGTYAHLGGTDMAITFDNSGNSFGDAYATIIDGKITSTYVGIRMRMADPSLNGNPGNGISCLTIKGGSIYGGSRGVWGQITNASAEPLGALDVTGGTIGGGNDAIRMTTDDYSNIDVTISGTAVIEGNITGEGSDFAISGGTFTVELPVDFFADGLIATKNADGTFGTRNIVSSDIFTQFYGYSTYVDETTGKASVAIGFDFVEDAFVSYCKAQGTEEYDIGCAFGIGTISKTVSFATYSLPGTLNAKIIGIIPTDSKYSDADLAMALYVQFDGGEMQYVAEIDGVIQFVTVEEVPTKTYNSLIKNQTN